MLPILMVAYELAVDQTACLGVGEGMSCGLINSLANLLGFIFVLVLTPLLGDKTESTAQTAMYALAGSLVLAIILNVASLIVRTKSKK